MRPLKTSKLSPVPDPAPGSAGFIGGQTRSLSLSIVVDDRALSGLTPEHGFALWLESEDVHILFDSGQGAVLEQNCTELGISLPDVDMLVLSHGHYDHSGGIPLVRERAPACHFYCGMEAMQSRYNVQQGQARAIHIPARAKSVLNNLPREQMHWVQGPVRLAPGIGVTGPIPRETAYEDAGGPFFFDEQGEHPDAVHEDQAIWINTGQGLVVCVACCHAGLINTLWYIRRLTGDVPIRAVVGGLHLLRADHTRLERTLEDLQPMLPEILVPCHCSGEEACAFFETMLGARVTRGAAGMRFAFPAS